MIIKSRNRLIFEPDVLKVEYIPGLENSHYIVAYKKNKKFIIQGYESEDEAIEVLEILSEVLKKGETLLEI